MSISRGVARSDGLVAKSLAFVAAFVLCLWVATPVMAADDDVTAAATVNKNLKVDIPKVGDLKRTVGATGVAAAAAKVYNTPQDDYRVSTAAGNSKANADQKSLLMDLLEEAKNVSKMGSKGRDAIADAVTKLKIDIVLAAIGDKFEQIAKAPDKTLDAKTDQLKNEGAQEFAAAEAKQSLTAINRDPKSPLSYKPEEIVTAEVRKGTAVMPMAAAVAFNIDPLGLEWDAPGGLRIGFDGSILNSATTGADSNSMSLMLLGASYRLGTTDIALPFSGSTLWYDLSLTVYGFDGGLPQYILDFDTYGNPVSDSLGNIGLAAVREGFERQLVVTSTGVTLPTNYSLIFDLPGSPSESVLYLRDASAAAAVAVTSVPEPTSLMLLATATLIVFCAARAKRLGDTAAANSALI